MRAGIVGVALLWVYTISQKLKASAEATKVIQDYNNRFDQIMSPLLGKQMTSFSEDSNNEEKLEMLSSMVKRLKLLKREIQMRSKEVGSAFARRTSQTPSSPFTDGVLAGLFGWRISQSVKSDGRQQERNRKYQAIAPFDQVISRIDEALLQIDTIILEIEELE